jgi:hypothetical protein
MYPQERAGRLPRDEDATLKEPNRRSLMLCFSRDIVIGRRIGRREPGP